MMKQRWLITGADGYLGRQIAQCGLPDPELELVLWVRAADEAELARKRDRLRAALPDGRAAVQVVAGDLRDAQPFAAVDPKGITAIVHTAAVTRFNVEADLADAVNRDGTRKTLEFARRCPALRRLGYISTVYSSGLAAGTVAETVQDPAGPFANHYERSKCEAEWLLHDEYRDLPWHIYRAATIIADDDSGTVGQYNVFHNTLRLLFHGLISLLPGTRATPIYLTTGAFTRDAVCHLLAAEEPVHRIYNLCYPAAANLSLGDLIDRVFANFAADRDFVKRRILQPLFADLDAFESLADALRGLSGAVVKQALDSIRPFSRQLFISKSMCNRNLRAAYPGYRDPDMASLTDKVTQYLIASKWGRGTRTHAADSQ